MAPSESPGTVKPPARTASRKDSPWARGGRVAHRLLRAALAAQETGQAVAAAGNQFGRPGLDDLPDACRRLDYKRIGAAEERDVGRAFQRPRQEIDHQRVAQIKARGRVGKEVEGQRADPGATAEGAQDPEAIGRSAAEDGDLARPGAGMGGDQGTMRGLVLTDLRQVQHTLGRWEARRFGPPCVRAGRMVLYRRRAVQDWLAAQEMPRAKVAGGRK